MCTGGRGVKKVVFCSGKIFYELAQERKARKMEDRVAILRVEQVRALERIFQAAS